MDSTVLVAIVILIMAVVFWALWNRRDRGELPARDIAESPMPERNRVL